MPDLLPLPKQISRKHGKHCLKPGGIAVMSALAHSRVEIIAGPLQQCLAKKGRSMKVVPVNSNSDRTGVVLDIRQSSGIPVQGYQLKITTEKIEIASGDEPGAYYGFCTLSQIIEQCGVDLPCLEILDWPDFPERGVMLDVSRTKIPKMDTLLNLVTLLGSWKINQVQLYFENAFAYKKHPAVWAGVSPFRSGEIRKLETYCKKRFIELVPNQNSFGHLANWLKHPAYSFLADKPGGDTLCPTDPECLKFLSGLYDELLPNFSSRKFNVGCDETNLGFGRSREACERKGVGRVYLEFLMEIYRLAKNHGRTMMFWADIMMQHPGLVRELPKDIIALEWGYGADHPFDDRCAKFAEPGIPFYVCPGTSSWNCLAGMTENAIGNLKNAAKNGLKHGAAGYLITDWGDNGHWQYLPASYPGLAYGAAVAWSYDSNQERNTAKMLDIHVFKDKTGKMGKLACDLGNVHKISGIDSLNTWVLVQIIFGKFEMTDLLSKIKTGSLAKTEKAIDKIMDALNKVKMNIPDAKLIKKEYRQTAYFLKHACRRGQAILKISGGISESGAGQLKKSLAKEMRSIINNHRYLWLKRNRPGGLEESLSGMKRRLREYG